MKLPAFQFYTGDWLKDTRALSLEAKGAWIEILVALWDAPVRGVLSFRLEGWARILGCSSDQADAVIRELSESGVAEIERISAGHIVIACRRMVREQLERARDKDRKADKLHEMWGSDYLGRFFAAYPALIRLFSAEYPPPLHLHLHKEREGEREAAGAPELPGKAEPLLLPPPAPARRPTGIDECLAHAQLIGLAEPDARDWHRDCEACGWTRGDGTPFDNWRRQMVVHRDHLAERRARAGPVSRPNSSPQPPPLSGAEIILRQKELERVETAIKAIQDQYDSHQSYSAKDRQELRRLRERREVLKKMLNLEA